MPGIDHLSIDGAVEEAGDGRGARHPGVLLFGLPADKDEQGSGAWDDEGVIQLADARDQGRAPRPAGDHRPVPVRVHRATATAACCAPDGVVDNDATLELLARTAVSQAEAGADAVAPSDMMDGRVGALRAALDDHGLAETPIIAYSAKFASAFYGPFREAADSAPQYGDRRGYQMDPANAREARARGRARRRGGRRHRHGQARAPVPGRHPPRARTRPTCRSPPTTSAASTRWSRPPPPQGLLDERAAVLEALTGIRRAGADIVITYHAKDVARWLSACQGPRPRRDGAADPARRDRQEAAEPDAGQLRPRPRSRSRTSPSSPASPRTR